MPLVNLRITARVKEGAIPAALTELANHWSTTAPERIEITGNLTADQANMRAAFDQKLASAPPPNGYTASFAGYHDIHGPHPRDWEWVDTAVDAVIDVTGPDEGYLTFELEQ